MIAERRAGNFASLRYDKLYINNDIYKYGKNTQSIDRIASRTTTQPRAYRGNLLATTLNGQSHGVYADSTRRKQLVTEDHRDKPHHLNNQSELWIGRYDEIDTHSDHE
ncbi:hypothetical protein DPMN_032281 [Dreissena polymorpha]|uniref:Uncharacterized protein n=1 Tax=Dreissena polymorpha TaxID=45954 RepID=A0A9D4M3W7_DREPO|nr:hypothetical protein DPMN_032281 [Dreissena polymorpha]